MVTITCETDWRGLLHKLAALLCFALFLSAQSAFEGVYTEAQAERDSKLYPDECDRCHGIQLPVIL